MQASVQKKVSIQYFIKHKIESGLDMIQLWIDRHHQRQQLAQLSEHMLKDIGLTRADVYKEIHKPFWK